MNQVITGFHQDEVGDWVAELSCGHGQHVRHRPPFYERAWVTEAAGRHSRIGGLLECPRCDQGEAPVRSPAEEGGDPACWAGLLCPECGIILDGSAHRPACPLRPPG